jgi:hypothetical protein
MAKSIGNSIVELTWSTPIVIVVIALVGWFWQDSLRVRDRANEAAIEACTRMALQFLDGTVAFANLRLVRDSGQLRLRRTYIFDYTAHSIERLQGFVVLLGMRVESVGFARNEAGRPAATVIRPNVANIVAEQSAEENADSATERDVRVGSTDSKILDLGEWRRTRNLH